jgi:hypothetical protein
LGIHGRNDHTGIGHLNGVATVPTYYATDRGTYFLGMLEGPYQIRTDVVLQVAATYGEDKDHIVGTQAAPL